MDRDRIVEVLFCGTHRDSDRETLHHLVDALANAVTTDHFQMLVVLAVILANLLAHKLKVTLLLVLLISRRVVHVGEWGIEHLDFVLAESLLRFLLRQSACTDGWVREDDRSNVVVVDLEVAPAVEKTLREGTTGSNSHWGECHLVRDVANGVHALYSRVLELVDFDGTAVKLYSRIVEGERSDVRGTAEGDKDIVTVDRFS